MAFEAYLDRGGDRGARVRNGRRRLTFTVSLALHGAGLAAAAGYSFWHVEELAPPAVAVTFVNALAPAAPPPPPPAHGGGNPAPPKRRPPLARTRPDAPAATPELVQPQPRPEPEREAPAPRADEPPAAAPPGPGRPDGVSGGAVEGGVAGGTIGGTPGSTGGGSPRTSPPPRFLPPSLGVLQRLSAPEPEFPVHLRRSGASYHATAKICVNPGGAVDSVTLVKRTDTALDGHVLSAVKGWRFRPLVAGSVAIPFCYFQPFEFKAD